MDEIGNEDSFADVLSEAWNGIHTCRGCKEDIRSVAVVKYHGQSLYIIAVEGVLTSPCIASSL